MTIVSLRMRRYRLSRGVCVGGFGRGGRLSACPSTGAIGSQHCKRSAGVRKAGRAGSGQGGRLENRRDPRSKMTGTARRAGSGCRDVGSGASGGDQAGIIGHQLDRYGRGRCGRCRAATQAARRSIARSRANSRRIAAAQALRDRARRRVSANADRRSRPAAGVGRRSAAGPTPSPPTRPARTARPPSRGSARRSSP